MPQLQGLQIECPVQVDMAAYKSEYLAQRYKGRLHPLHHYVFGFADRLARWGSVTPALTNALLTGPVTSMLIKWIIGVTQERQLPRLAAKSYQRGRALDAATEGERVLLWPDTWNNYYHPQTMAAADRVLTQAGFRVHIPKGTSAADARFTTSACSARHAGTSPRFSIAWPTRSMPAIRSSSLNLAAPASSRMSCWNCSQ